MIDDLDRLGIASAAVTPSWMLIGDPRSAAEYELERSPFEDERLVRVPVILPGAAGSGWPDSIDALYRLNPKIVRACPERHRFDAHGSVAMTWWNDLADRGIALALDASECGLPLVASVADAVPNLKMLMLTPGYRELRRLAELLTVAPEVFVETGTIVSAGGVEWLARAVGAQRLVFGTGAPIWDDAGPRFQLDHLDLKNEDVEMIAHGSWDRLTGGTA
ncbi:amidohydrolase family protein [Microbacterium sp.]|uniref:amidohydrolase family protein n=1 Tax=Microbacterium sp. TaxID=51671 RepID=UPI00273593C8|nr:amidohydrolase family protein [Microbacterium sp.]